MKTQFKGMEVQLTAELPKVGTIAPDFRFVTTDLQTENLYSLLGKVKMILTAPSVDTGVCAKEAKLFNEKMQNLKNLTVLFVTMDLPFALKRFCLAEGIENLKIGSDFRFSEVGQKYGVKLKNTPLEALLARAVWVLNEKNEIVYTELVPEITQEPDYQKAFEVIERLA